MLHFLIFLQHVICTKSRNFAILVNTSKDFHNYRHISNIVTFYKMLTESGYQPSNIICLTPENQLKDIRNIYPSKFYHSQTEGYSIPEIQYEFASINNFLNILRCNHPKMINIDKRTSILIYICGHGGNSYIKFSDRDFLHTDDIMHNLKYLALATNKILFFIDTCQAETLVDVNALPDNVYVVATSKKNQPSISNRGNCDIGCAVVDNFVYELNDVYVELDNKDVLLKSVLDLITKEKIQSDIFYTSNVSEIMIFDFFKQKEYISR